MSKTNWRKTSVLSTELLGGWSGGKGGGYWGGGPAAALSGTQQRGASTAVPNPKYPKYYVYVIKLEEKSNGNRG